MTKVTKVEIPGLLEACPCDGINRIPPPADCQKVTKVREVKKPGPRAAYSGYPGPFSATPRLTLGSGIKGAIRRARIVMSRSGSLGPGPPREARKALKSSSGKPGMTARLEQAQVYYSTRKTGLRSGTGLRSAPQATRAVHTPW